MVVITHPKKNVCLRRLKHRTTGMASRPIFLYLFPVPTVRGNPKSRYRVGWHYCRGERTA